MTTNNILTISLHKTNRILKEMKLDSRINKNYIDYAEGIKLDIEYILKDN